MSERLPFPRAELRRRTLRGTIVTAGFLVAIDARVLGANFAAWYDITQSGLATSLQQAGFTAVEPLPPPPPEPVPARRTLPNFIAAGVVPANSHGI